MSIDNLSATLTAPSPALGGEVSIISEPGKGTTVTLHVPLQVNKTVFV